MKHTKNMTREELEASVWMLKRELRASNKGLRRSQEAYRSILLWVANRHGEECSVG